MKNNADRKKALIDFCKGFFITLVIILPVYVGVYYWQLEKSADKLSEISALPAKAVPVATKSYNLLWMVSDSATESLVSCTIVRFDVNLQRAVISELPCNTVLLSGKTPMSVYELHAQRKASGVKAAVEETLSVPISGYLLLKTDVLSKIIDGFGGFSYTLDKKLEVKNESGHVVFKKDSGTSLFCGNDVAHLLVYGLYEGAEKTQIREKLWQSALLQFCDDDFGKKIRQLYSENVNQLSSNIGPTGLLELSRIAETVCLSLPATVDIVRMGGVYADNRFELSENSDERLWDCFSKLN
ncbi:MAG: hypothetical protein RR058_03675 [Oscillospiraceae bacterium]